MPSNTICLVCLSTHGQGYSFVKERGWIAYVARGPSDGEHLLQSRINGYCEWPCSTQPLNIPMLNGDQSIHIRKHHDLSHWQQVVRPALDFIQYTPHNMYSNLLEVQISIFVDGGPILHMCFLTTPPQHAWSPRVPSVFWLCCVIEIQVHWRLHSPGWASYDMMTHQFCLVRCQLQDKHKLCLVVELVSVCEKVQRFSVLRDLQNLFQDGHMSSRAMCSLYIHQSATRHNSQNQCLWRMCRCKQDSRVPFCNRPPKRVSRSTL